MVVEDVYEASQMVMCGFQVVIHRDDFGQLKDLLHRQNGLIAYGIGDVLYVKIK